MDQYPLKVIAIGLDERLRPLLEAAFRNPAFSIVAVADADPEKAAKFAEQFGCPSYNDFRQLIIQSQADVLMVAAPVFQCAEHIDLAIEKQMHIFKMPPAALNFEQAAQWIRETARRSRRFIVIQEGRFHPLLDCLRQKLDQEEVSFWHLISAVFHVPALPLDTHRWLYDPSQAGGGVLLRNAYNLIDELVLCFGLPQQVYAQIASQAPDRQQRMSLTEDTALMIMRFSDTLLAQLSASRTLGPARRHLRIHGKDRFLTLTAFSLASGSQDGRLLEEKRWLGPDTHWADRLLDNFLKSLDEKNRIPLFPPPETDLKTMAVIESAYLSAKTGMPEEPVRILHLAGLKSEGLWS